MLAFAETNTSIFFISLSIPVDHNELLNCDMNFNVDTTYRACCELYAVKAPFFHHG